jgi:hypothetical protein
MAAGNASGGSANPFARGTVLLMVAIGFAAFLALLYAIGAGGALRSGNNGAAHGASVSAIGYSALGRLLEQTGTKVSYGRSPNSLQQQGLLIVTPELSADPEELAAMVNQRRTLGPTLIILPKWQATPEQGLRAGWVRLESPSVALQAPQVLSQLVQARTRLEGSDSEFTSLPPIDLAKPAQQAAVLKAALKSRVTISGSGLRTVLADPATGAARVAVIDDGSLPSSPETVAEPQAITGFGGPLYRTVIVADADLMNNLGLASRETAAQALQILDVAGARNEQDVVFDLTQNGLGTSENLLSVAFRPPFVGAVVSLALAAIAFGWMAFCRFGPALAEAQPFGFGKTALVKGGAGLMRRLGRDHLTAPAYADLVRERAARSLGLPAGMPHQQVDERLAMVSPDAEGRSYETLSASMRAARDRPSIVAAARALHAWKKERLG